MGPLIVNNVTHMYLQGFLIHDFLSVLLQSRSMIQAKDYDGARRLGRLALLLSIVSIVVGLAIVLYLLLTGKLYLFFSTHTHTHTGE